MSKPSHHDKILDAGLEVFYRNGFHASGVQDVVSKAGVPKGSFYNHFPSKEALGVAVIEHYVALRADALALLDDGTLPPLERIDRHFVAIGFAQEGCLVGNFTAELARQGMIRNKLAEVWGIWAGHIACCIDSGQRDGSIRNDLPSAELARSALALWEGSVLISRVDGTASAMDAARRALRRLLVV